MSWCAWSIREKEASPIFFEIKNMFSVGREVTCTVLLRGIFLFFFVGESLLQQTISWGKMGMVVPSWVGGSGLLAAFMIFYKEPDKSLAAPTCVC